MFEMTSPRRTQYDNNFDNNNEGKYMEDMNNSMENTTISDEMRTVTLHFDQLWKMFCSYHIWSRK